MPTYIVLTNYTDQGVKSIRDTPKRHEQYLKNTTASGGKVIAEYVVIGQYDRVAIIEYPNDEAMLAHLLRIGAGGNVRTTTLKAFTQAEFTKIVQKLP